MTPLAFAAGVAVLAGCGGGPSGKALYAKDCESCHTLTGRDQGAMGGDLGVPHLSVADLASFARTMPVRPPLNEAQANAVARYVHSRAEHLRRRTS
jgi:mono/diheme cytochrome c family protein